MCCNCSCHDDEFDAEAFAAAYEDATPMMKTYMRKHIVDSLQPSVFAAVDSGKIAGIARWNSTEKE